ncbi:MAG: gamma-glutamyltransferase [Bryobacterales bacterium]|nr:gamma-glutamyltransferase [Bryobacterales bacterium]
MMKLRVPLVLVIVAALLGAQEVSQSGRRLRGPRPVVALPERAPAVMAASVHPLATEAALEILRKGGNAVDAAVAIGFVLAVVHPEAGNIGGGGFLLAHMADGRSTVVDYAFKAPQAFRKEIYAGEKNTNIGYKTIGVPGMPAGMGRAHAKFGRLKWAEVLEPARRLAHNGFPASQRMEIILALQVPVMKPFAETAKIFLKGSDQPLKQGDMVVQKDLAATIARLQKHGWQEFYTGETAKRMVQDIGANGGILTAQDLASYEAIDTQPIKVNYRGYPVLITAGHSSGGTTLAVALNLLNRFELKLGMEGSSAARHLQVEAMGAGARAARLMTSGKVPLAELLSDGYTKKLADGLSLDRATPPPAPPSDGGAEGFDTTHYTVVDKDGNIVTNTYTLNGFFGSQVVAKGTGVLMNNYMNPRRTEAAGSRIYSSMTPTVLLRQDGKPWAAFGSPGSETIPSTVLQIVNNLVDFKMGLRDAVEYPRIHAGRSGPVDFEPGALVFDVAERLKDMGHALAREARSQGDVNAVAIEEGTGWKLGWADGRRGGFVKGY